MSLDLVDPLMRCCAATHPLARELADLSDAVDSLLTAFPHLMELSPPSPSASANLSWQSALVSLLIGFRRPASTDLSGSVQEVCWHCFWLANVPRLWSLFVSPSPPFRPLPLFFAAC